MPQEEKSKSIQGVKPVAKPAFKSVSAKSVTAKQVDDNQPILESTSKPGSAASKVEKTSKVKEIGGPKGLEPTRYGDWEAKGRCYDF